MRRLSRGLASGLAILMAGLLALTASAQPATPVLPTPAPAGLLAEVQVDQLPSPHAEVWLVRFTLEPGGFLPSDLQIGPTIAIIEQGVVTLESDQPVEVTGSGAEPVMTGTPETVVTVVEAGQTAYIREDTRLAVRNDSDAPAIMLALIVFSAERESEAMAEDEGAGAAMAEPRGVTSQLLGVTGAEFPAGPGTITIERFALEADGTRSLDLLDGAVVGSVEQGDATLSVTAGSCFIWPALGAPGEQPDTEEPARHEVGPGQSAGLPAGDGFGCSAGAIAWQAGAAGATIIQAAVMPSVPATPEPTPAP